MLIIGGVYLPNHRKNRTYVWYMKGILSKETHASIIRFAPPLIIEKKEIDWAVHTFKETLKEIEKNQIHQ